MRLELFYPVYPHKVNQKWGVYDPRYQKYGFKQHNGVDLDLVDGQEIRAPFDCTVIKVAYQTGGGLFVGILSKNLYEFEDSHAYVLLDFLHCKEIKVSVGQKVKVGELLALGDSTGDSTGPHTHMQCRWKDGNLNDLEKNDANNSFDPTPHWTGHYALEFAQVRIFEKIFRAIKAFFGGAGYAFFLINVGNLLSKVVNGDKNLWKTWL